MKRTKLFSFMLLFLFCFSLLSCQEGKTVKLSTTPDALLEKMINNPAFEKNPSGEGFCWQANVGATQFVNNYEVTGDTKWLDAGVKYYDFLISRMDTDPDGYKGWIGERKRGDRVVCTDALVGDASLLSSILDFAVLVNENPELKTKYGKKADSYVQVAKKDFVEKYDHRGSWVEDGPFASYVSVPGFVKTDSAKTWLPRTQPGVSNPFNKLFDGADGLMRF